MIIDVNIKQPNRVDKKWGYELWIHNDSDYCGKLLVFNKCGDKFSMHYHLKKKETWYVQRGGFIFNWIDVENGKLHTKVLAIGDSVLIDRGLPHQLEAMMDASTIFEVSTEHFDEDSYRIYRNNSDDLKG
jgi:mannose-6-phosphate isomerase-like protein (cupin superfamily)